ncbi:hypothetical protein FHW69_000171 [Luteibacter sp. Sphag1AF]|nr:hypothetical protein [Luteibacter sp. Sphag1AF]
MDKRKTGFPRIVAAKADTCALPCNLIHATKGFHA